MKDLQVRLQVYFDFHQYIHHGIQGYYFIYLQLLSLTPLCMKAAQPSLVFIFALSQVPCILGSYLSVLTTFKFGAGNIFHRL